MLLLLSNNLSGLTPIVTQNLVIYQALAQCENTLTKLGLVREAVDDTAGAAKVSRDIMTSLEDSTICVVH